ncbi:MAG: class I SAM-dependent methyltransferase [Bacteroidota bacterium]
MLYQIKSYLKFLLRSTNQHGVHSPFVFDLVTRCFYDTTSYPEYVILKRHRQNLLDSTETIEVKDFGAGSRVFKGNIRKVWAIARNAGVTAKRQRLLFRLAHYFKPENILEMGTSLGLGTIALGLGNAGAKVVTVEGCPQTSEKAKALFQQFKLDQINLHNETFETFLERDDQKYDLVYIDGNHDKERTLRYFQLLLQRVQNGSVLIFDDIYWSKAMTEAWQEIKAHPKVTVSIDTFQWGMVFFRKEQKKEHFYLRM